MKSVCVQNESTNSDFITQICKKPAFVTISDLNFRGGFLTRRMEIFWYVLRFLQSVT